ncbi:ABC transporter ATP-binding protein [Streptococcus catagoni]|uniref:ABC transporter ATP-binding protein n=1 Tax=Streptococcus catagoni TaxID=2654874 RepID=UPI001407B257|nr:ABC transporter ATP-binding protein [Streptococcus catagoni]
MTAIRFHQLSKSFADKKILENLSLSLEENKIYGFIGPNGAGKTTTLKMLLGLLKIDSGNIQIFEEEVTFGKTPTNRHIGYLPDVPEFYDYMTAKEYLQLCAKFNQQSQNVQELLEKVGLKDSKQLISSFSRGMKQRLGLAQALIHDPKILICDEPTSALDPKGRQDILEIISNLRGKKTVIFSTHVLSDVEKICDDILVLRKKTIQNIDDLKDSLPRKQSLRISLKAQESDYLLLKEHFKLEKEDNRVILHLPIKETQTEEKSLKDFYQRLNSCKIYPRAIEVLDQSLEDIYLEVNS